MYAQYQVWATRSLYGMRMTLRILAVAITLILGLSHGVTAASAEDSLPTVTIEAGTIIGTTTRLSQATANVNQFLGVPFASPPVRFAPPTPIEPWTKPLEAQSRPPACIQQFNFPSKARSRQMYLYNDPFHDPPEESEDCLYLNVFSPPGTTASDKKAVLFWIFGGNLMFGAGNLRLYDGSSFAYNQDVIVVTFNYRTNVFGFPGSPQLDIRVQNVGLLDQRAALAFVKENIQAFGGDPDKITIFGESAGAFSVKQLLALPPDPVPFRAAILQSEGALETTNSTLSWTRLATEIGCLTAEDVLDCVRGKPASQIKSVIENRRLSFFPRPDGVTNTKDLYPTIVSKSAANVPVLLGTNMDEGRPFLWAQGAQDDPTFTLTDFLNKLFPDNLSLRLGLEHLFQGNVAYLAAGQIVTQYYFQCRAAKLSQTLHEHGRDVYRYLYNATFPNTQLFPVAGVWHSSEIPIVFGTYWRRNELGAATKTQVQLSKYIQTAWASFAKNPSSAPSQDWRELGDTENVLNLGSDGDVGGHMIQASDIDGLCPLLAPVLDLIGLL